MPGKSLSQKKKLNGVPIEIKIIFFILVGLFIAFLFVPLVLLLVKSFYSKGSLSFSHYHTILTSSGFMTALINSFKVSGLSAFITTILAFFLAYTVNHTNLNEKFKSGFSTLAVLPMLLPTITYGFAIIYSFGKQGLITKILGFQPFEIYGFNGLLMGYVIYTLPIAFLLIHNTFRYVDKKFVIVSKIMGDRPLKTFFITTIRPLIGTLGAAFIQSFFLCFTDFGIPTSVGGEYSVVATTLYNEMLGAIPNFNNGAVVAMIMLIPSILGIWALHCLEKYNFRYSKISQIELRQNKLRDYTCAGISSIILLCILSVFAVVILIPFVKSWPYDLSFSFDNIAKALASPKLSQVYLNSIFVAILTAIIGTTLAILGALVTARSQLSKKLIALIDGISLVTNTVPGMVLGISFLFAFSGSSLQSTFVILIICNVIHFFSTPYLMIKNSLLKMNSSWETTAMLMGDNWIKTVFRVVLPNSITTIFEMLSYYFVNAMVTISAVIFIVGAKTMVITTRIKELQHFGNFNEIFILSLLILLTNIIAKVILKLLSNKKHTKRSLSK